MVHSDLMQQFESLDADGSGFLSRDELLVQMPERSREKARSVLEMMDNNADGKVSYKEFVDFYFEGFDAVEIGGSEDSVEVDDSNPADTNNDGIIDSYEEMTSGKF